MQNKEIDALTKVLSRLTQPKELSKQKVIDSLLGKKATASISNSPKMRKRAKMPEAIKTVQQVEQIPQVDSIDPIPDIPAAITEPVVGGSDNIPGLPQGTKMINENLWLLPDGRFLTKNQEDDDESV